MSNKELFAYWIQERWDVMCVKNEGKPAPWSRDTIFHSTYFTNVRREDDRVTKYIREQWIGPRKIKEKACRENLVPALVLARLFNRPETLSAMGYPFTWDVPGMKAGVEQLRQHNQQVFSGAYLITTCGEKIDKLDYVFRVANDVWNQDWSDDCLESMVRRLGPHTCYRWHERLMKTRGLGSFLAAQVIADLKNTVGHPLADASDWWTITASGPGSKKGMNYYFGYDPMRGMSEHEFITRVAVIREEVMPKLEGIPKICNQDLQNCLCEFSKYMRIRSGKGRSKRIYKGK